MELSTHFNVTVSSGEINEKRETSFQIQTEDPLAF